MCCLPRCSSCPQRFGTANARCHPRPQVDVSSRGTDWDWCAGEHVIAQGLVLAVMLNLREENLRKGRKRAVGRYVSPGPSHRFEGDVVSAVAHHSVGGVTSHRLLDFLHPFPGGTASTLQVHQLLLMVVVIAVQKLSLRNGQQLQTVLLPIISVWVEHLNEFDSVGGRERWRSIGPRPTPSLRKPWWMYVSVWKSVTPPDSLFSFAGVSERRRDRTLAFMQKQEGVTNT